MHAEKFLPMVINLRRDTISNNAAAPGGQITIETRAPIVIERCAVDQLPIEVEATIDRWLVTKRHELQALAAKKVKAGAEHIRINERGEMRKI